jgi:Na+-translocating ferredoxin:NAD+ oxidoreductase RnfA subunit
MVARSPEPMRRAVSSRALMDLLLDILQGVGIAAAIGVRPLFPVILAGALAAANVGLDFDGTDFAFLEAWPFLVAVLVVAGGMEFAARRGAPESGSLALALLALVVALGALEGAGSVADRSDPWIVGLLLGAAAAALGYFAARSLFARVRRRLDAQAASALPVYGEAAALVGAGASILFPPLAVLVIGGLAWLLAGGRRREGEKYAGLRILR